MLMEGGRGWGGAIALLETGRGHKSRHHQRVGFEAKINLEICRATFLSCHQNPRRTFYGIVAAGRRIHFDRGEPPGCSMK